MEGLYKIEKGNLICAKNNIFYADGTIIEVESMRNSYAEYDGWRWFNNREQAKQYYGFEDTTNEIPKIQPYGI